MPNKRRDFEDFLGDRPFGHLYRSSYRSKAVRCLGEIRRLEDGSWECVACAKPCPVCEGEGHPTRGTGEDTWHGELRHSKIWTIKYSDGHGRPLYRSTKTSDWNKAQAVRKKLFREVMGGEAPWEPRQETTLGQVLDIVIAHYEKNKKRSLRRQQEAREHVLSYPPFRKGTILAAEVTTTAVMDGYVTFRQKEEAANATINRELGLIRHGFRIAVARQDARGRFLVVRAPAIELLDEPRPRDVTIDDSEYQRIHAALEARAPDVADLVECYRLTGWRNSEPRNLEWASDINWFAKTVRLRSVITKSGDFFELPFGDDPDLESLLRKRLKLADEVERQTGQRVQWVFFRRGRQGKAGKRSNKLAGRRIASFQKDWDRALRNAGLPDSGPQKKRPHDFRRGAADLTVEVTSDLQTAAHAIGWQSVRSLLRYIKGDKKAVARTVKDRAELRAQRQKEAAQLGLRFAKGKGED